MAGWPGSNAVSLLRCMGSELIMMISPMGNSLCQSGTTGLLLLDAERRAGIDLHFRSYLLRRDLFSWLRWLEAHGVVGCPVFSCVYLAADS